MAKPFELKMIIEGRDELYVSGEFTDDEYAALLLYLEQYDQLEQSKPLREGFPCEISLKYEQGKNPEVRTSLPDNDTLSILLHRLRPFILQKEPASYLVVSAIVGKRVSDFYIKQLLHEQRRLYDGRDAQQQMQIASNDIIVNSGKMLNDWLNAHEYHRDPDKREAIDALFEKMPGDFMRALMVSMLVDKIKAIRNIAALVAVLLGKTNSLKFHTYEKVQKEATENK